MHFGWTGEQEELRAAARRFLAEYSSSERLRAAMETELGYDPELWKRMAGELGWTALLVPEEHEGLGLGFVELVALLETMGEALLCAPFFSTVCLGANALCTAGSPEQQREHLPAIAEGRVLATLAERAEIEVRAAEGGVTLSGVASQVLDGHSADLLVLPAGDSLFLVRGALPGVERERLPTLDPTRRLARVSLRDLRLPESARLGEPGRGPALLEEILDRARVALAAEQLGGAQRCLDLSVAHAKQRVQFGRPIGSFQAIKHKCADMLVAVESARSASYHGGWVAAQSVPPDALARAASLAKATASESFTRCAGEAIQIHGGVGFTWEYDAQLYFKRARASASFLGTAAFHRERVARQLLAGGAGAAG